MEHNPKADWKIYQILSKKIASIEISSEENDLKPATDFLANLKHNAGPWLFVTYFLLSLGALNIAYGCLGGGNPSDINLWWVLWISIYRMRRS